MSTSLETVIVVDFNTIWDDHDDGANPKNARNSDELHLTVEESETR